MVDVKRELNLEGIPETIIPINELKPYLNEEGKSISFEEGNQLMIIVIVDEKLMKKRVNKKHFNGIYE